MKKQWLKMTWLAKLKIAVIEKNITSIEELIRDVPKIDDLKEAHEILALVQEAISIVEQEKAKALATMNKIKQSKVFMQNQ